MTAADKRTPPRRATWWICQWLGFHFRLIANWLDDSAGTWMDEIFLQKQVERGDELKRRLNGLHDALESALAQSPPNSVDLSVLVGQALDDFPAEPGPVHVETR